jgi:DNA-binding MarR family transcriptional regulator
MITAKSVYVERDQRFGFQSIRAKVLRELLAGDFTDQEVAERLGAKAKTVSADRVALWKKGLVEPIGHRKMTRQRAKIWRLTPEGRARAGESSGG